MSYCETEAECFDTHVVKANVLFFFRKLREVECSLLLLNRANSELLWGCPTSSGFLGCPTFFSPMLHAIPERKSVMSGERKTPCYLLLDLAKEVGNDTPLRYAEDFGVSVPGVIGSEHIIAFIISVIVGIVDNVDETIVAHSTRKGWFDNRGMLRLADLARKASDRSGV